MSILFFGKYEGAGNDFIIIEDLHQNFDPNLVPKLCHRRFGIGADGVILLQNDIVADFRMRYFNADGTEAASCGNGLRCLMQFIRDQGYEEKKYEIATGKHIVVGSFWDEKICIELGKAKNIKKLQIDGHDLYSLDTGVPHAVLFSSPFELAEKIRHHPIFKPAGTNVNFAFLQLNGSIQVRTFERGVEGETLACGTGAAAVAVIANKFHQIPSPIRLCFPGGDIEIYLKDDQTSIVGEAFFVFEGVVKNL